MVSIKIVNRSDNPLPEYATDGAAGMDLRAFLPESIRLKPLERQLIPTGIFIELPAGYEAQIRPRSGLAFQQGITCLNTPGTIDSDYRGEIKILLINLSTEEHLIETGERIAQMVIQKVERAVWEEAGQLTITQRNEGGFGSTGKKKDLMTRLTVLLAGIIVLASCRSTKKIQTAISMKDTSVVVAVSPPNQVDEKRRDTMMYLHHMFNMIDSSRIRYKTFTAKVNVDYRSGEGRNYNLNAVIRMYKDSAIWISANALLGIEALRVYITRDSVKVLDKLNKVYTARSVDYIRDVTALPLDLGMLQDLLIGNPVFLDSNVVSYSNRDNIISILSVGEWFKNLITYDRGERTLLHCKLDDADIIRNRTADLTYSDYDDKKDVNFSTKRNITVAEKKKLDIRLDFRQYDFNQGVSFPFNIPRSYDRN